MEQVTIKNNYIELTALTYGAIIKEILVSNKNGIKQNVVVGLDHEDAYINDNMFLGACVGRYAGRISNKGFTLNGKFYELHNVAGIHLHGGKEGFGKKIWKILNIENGENPSVTFEYLSPHMEEGYPGNLQVRVTYRLRDNALEILHEATTDATTVLNLTNHSYFILDQTGSLDHHYLQLNSNQYIETDERVVPTGKIKEVYDTAFDFRKVRSVKHKGLDTPFICSAKEQTIASIYSSQSGIRMQVQSNQPAVVIYTPSDFAAICFETQNFPDAPNHKNFPSAVLHPNDTYRNDSRFIFDLVP